MKQNPPSKSHWLRDNASDWIGPKKGDPSPILYFSGVRKFGKFGAMDIIHERTAWTHRCLSYDYLANPRNYEVRDEWEACKRVGTHVMIDSGAHTFLAATKSHKGTFDLKKYLRGYAEWITQNRHLLDFYVNFDYIKDAPEVYRVQRELEKLGIRPTPVFHGDKPLDWIKRYSDEGHKLIGIGKPTGFTTGGASLRRKHYDHVFNLTVKLGMKCHGFAVTGTSMFTYPWHSVDSASWLKLAVYGKVALYDPHSRVFDAFHISELGKGITKQGAKGLNALGPTAERALKARCRMMGYDMALLRKHSFHRAIFNARQFLAAQTADAQILRKGWQQIF